jgi:hypothetical protein
MFRSYIGALASAMVPKRDADVFTDGDGVVLVSELAGDVLETRMTADQAEEVAHALLLCAAAARGRGIDEHDLALVERWSLR